MSAPADGRHRGKEPQGWRDLIPVAPLHPILVHFTIALTASSLLFDFLSRLRDDQTLAHAGWWTLGFSVVVTVLTIATGFVSRASVELGEGRARSYLRAHMVLGVLFFGLLLAIGAWRFALWHERRIADWLYLSALAALNLMMLVQGYLGGELVYRWGADVRGGHVTLGQEQAGTAPPGRRGLKAMRASSIDC